MWVNIGCGRFRAPAPWINLDVIETGQIRPDHVVDRLVPLIGFDNVERVYLGHVLEHIPWSIVVPFLHHVQDHLVPGGEIAVVGPDIWRCIASAPAVLVEALEDDVHHQADDIDWDGARHHWNCYEARLVRVLTAAGFSDVAARPVTADALAGWPVVAFTDWQCAVTATSPIAPT